MTVRETPDDVRNEDEVAEYLRERWLCDHQFKIGADFSPIDRAFVRGDKLMALCEIKTSSSAFSEKRRWGFVYVDLGKIEYALAIKKMLGIPVFIAYRFTDGLRYIEPGWDYKIHKVGRTDRGDPADIREACAVPLEEWKQ